MIKDRLTSLWNFKRMYFLGKLIDFDTSPIEIRVNFGLSFKFTQNYTFENWWSDINFLFVQESQEADADLFWTFPHELPLAYIVIDS